MFKQEYNKKICGFRTNYDLFFLMNTLLQIKLNSLSYCFCDWINQEKCLICEIITDFNGFEEKLTGNMKNIDFLKKYQSKLYPYLSKFFYVNKSSICSFLDGEYFHLILERSGRTRQLFLSDMIEGIENANLENT